MNLTSVEFAKFAIEKVGTPYVMGTNGKILDRATYYKLLKANPNGWFVPSRAMKAMKYIGKQTTDCHGLAEWFYRECTGKEKDITANMSIQQSDTKGDISHIPNVPGTCVWKAGHFGVYIGGGYVVEAKGIDYGVCITRLSDTKWLKWFDHPWITYKENRLPDPTKKICKSSSIYDIVWLQIQLNYQIMAKHIDVPKLTVDGQYGAKTEKAVSAIKEYLRGTKWYESGSGASVGTKVIKYLGNPIIDWKVNKHDYFM